MSTANRDGIDDAIDRVVARLVRVEENDALAAHIISALPERPGRFGWWFHSWAPRLAMIAIVVAAGIVWGNRAPAVTPQPDTLASTPTVVEPFGLVAAIREAAPNRTMSLEPLELLEPLAPLEPLASQDFERSLAAIGAPEALLLGALAADSLPASDALSVEPLVIADLPLAAEPEYPR